MIIGDPFDVAIRFDVVKIWNEGSDWVNGIFEIYINGEPYPKTLCETEFRVNIFHFFSGFHKNMKEIDSRDFELLCINQEKDVIDKLMEENKMHEISSSEMSDSGCSIYFFFNPEHDFLLVNNNQSLEIFEYKKNHIFNMFQELEDNKNEIFSTILEL